jgi:hypothetical protein
MKSQVVSTPLWPFLFSVFVLCFYRSLRTAMYPEKCSRLLRVLWWRFVKPKYSWPYSQEPVTGPCSETWMQSITPYPLFTTNINVSFRPTIQSRKCSSNQRFLIPPMRAACSVYLILLDFITQLLCVDVYKLWSSSLFTSVLIFLSLNFSRSARRFFLEARLVTSFVLPSEWQNIRIFNRHIFK